MSRGRLEALGWAVALSAAVVLRLVFLDLNGMWGDEAYSVKMALTPLRGLIAATSCNGACGDQPPFYYVLLRIWVLAFGSSDWTVRLMSVVLDLLALVAVYDLARTVARSRAVAWITLALHVLSPFAILYAQEARMYSLLLLVSAVSTSFLVKLLERPTGARSAVYVLATLGALYTHPFGVFLVVAQNLFVSWRWFVQGRPGGFRAAAKWAGFQALVGSLFVPWAWLIVRQLLVAGGGKRPDGWWIPRPPVKALAGPFWVFLGESYILLGLVGMLLVVALVREFRRRDRREGLVLLWLCTLTPILLSFVESWIGPPSFVARYMTPGFPAFLVLVAWALWETGSLQLRGVLGAVVSVLLVKATMSTNYGNSFKAPTPYREIVLELARQDLSRTSVVLSDENVFAWSVERYAVQSAAPGSPLLSPVILTSQTSISREVERIVFLGKTAQGVPPQIVAADGRVFLAGAPEVHRELVVSRYVPVER